jgi:hypothetical protein
MRCRRIPSLRYKVARNTSDQCPHMSLIVSRVRLHWTLVHTNSTSHFFTKLKVVAPPELVRLVASIKVAIEPIPRTARTIRWNRAYYRIAEQLNDRTTNT